MGCTLSYKKYNCNDWTLFDIAGLSEGSQGTVDQHEAIKQLQSLLSFLGQNEISLAIMVIGKSKITATMEQNYKLFAKKIFMEKVPVLLMVTKCEEYENMGVWCQKNKIYFELYKMTFADVICGCAKESSSSNVMAVFLQLYKEQCSITRQALIESINRKMLPKLWVMKSEEQWMKLIMKDVLWILLACCTHRLEFHPPRAQAVKLLINTMVDMGWELMEAHLLVNDVIKEIKLK